MNRERSGPSAAPSRARALRVVVLGYLVRGPLGGMVWSNLQYLRGLSRLGHDVCFLEDSDDYPSCYDPSREVTDTDPTFGLNFAQRVFARIGMPDQWAYHDAHGTGWHGPARDRILEICGSADVVLNLCGMNPLRPWLLEIPVRIYVDQDPVFTQVRLLTKAAERERAAQHTAFFTFAENLGRTECRLPDDGFPWQVTRQPFVRNSLQASAGRPGGRFTTVMLWNSYPAVSYAGMRYGMKADSFAPYLEMPRSTSQVLELAVGGAGAPLAALRENGWRVRDPRSLSRDPWTYERYLRGSKAEFGIAKHGYVVSRSGWFSERSVAYLASGRPVLAHDTGFTNWLPTGAGLVPFSSPEEAVAGIGEINARYAFHCRAARELVEAHFDSDAVLTRLLERAC